MGPEDNTKLKQDSPNAINKVKKPKRKNMEDDIMPDKGGFEGIDITGIPQRMRHEGPIDISPVLGKEQNKLNKKKDLEQ